MKWLQNKRINSIFLVLFGWHLAIGQVSIELGYTGSAFSGGRLEKKFDFKRTYKDTSAMFDGLNRLIGQLHDASYLEAAVDSFHRIDTSRFWAGIHIGPAYEWITLESDEIPKSWLGRSGFRKKLYQHRPFSFGEYQKLQKKLLEEAENNGYPFARLRLDKVAFERAAIRANLQLDKDSLVLVEGLRVESEAKISDLYLQNYLGIRNFSPYNRSRILKIKDRLRELPFLEADSDPTISFTGDRALVNLSLKKKQSSKFDFIIGVLPNSRETGRLLVTGNFNGEFLNQFGRGERLFIAFEQLRPLTQELEIQFNYPYVFNLPFGIDAEFNFYKRDSTYLDLEFDIGVQYLLEGGNYLKAFWNNKTSDLLAIDEAAIVRRGRLPESLDYSNASFGLEVYQQNLDYRFNPRKGWAAFLKAAAGTKKVKRDNEIAALEIGNLYDSLQLRSFQYRMEMRLEAYLPLFSRSTVKFAFRGGSVISESPIYFNEQFRIGGNQILRGFDEESIFATHFGVLTTEYRILIGENSYLYTFADLAYVEDKIVERQATDRILGFGAGITFETKVGLFGLSLAFGRTKRIPFDFGTPKLHFGYVSLF